MLKCRRYKGTDGDLFDLLRSAAIVDRLWKTASATTGARGFRPLGLAILIASALTPAAIAQYRFDSWTADNGLPSNGIRGICQTSDGYIWLATFDGLARFDGVRFTVFDKSNTPGITSNRFASMYKDANDAIWLGTEGGGVTRFHRGRFVSYSSAHGVPGRTVAAISGDKEGNVWILADDTIARWDAAKDRFTDATPHDLRIHFSLLFWEGGSFWGEDSRGLHCFIRGRFVNWPLPSWLAGNIRTAAMEPDGRVWLATNDGKLATIHNGAIREQPARTAATEYRDSQGQSWKLRVLDNLARSMRSRSGSGTIDLPVSSVFDDQEGNLWLATEGRGLYRVRRQFIETISVEQGLAGSNIYPIYQDRTGDIWIGAWPTGLSRYHEGRYINYSTKDGLPARLVTTIAEDSKGRIWVGTHGGLTIWENGRFRKPPALLIPAPLPVNAIHEDREGTLWFGTPRGLVVYRNGESKVFTSTQGQGVEDVRVIVESAFGGLWIGGYSGLYRLRNGELRHWTESDGLPSSSVRAVYEDRNGVVWIGTYDGGLGRLHNNKVTRIGVREGLFNNGVFQILDDGRGNFWMSSNRGIYRVAQNELNRFAAGEQSAVTSVAYGRQDGMLNAECNGGSSPAGIRAKDGRLWFPTQEGIVVLDASAVRSNPKPPPVLIESVLVDRTPVPIDGAIRIPAGKENLEIQWTALSFINSDQIRFRYRLEGLDSGWLDAGLRRTAYYAHLPPRDYTFTVIARNSDGVWNNQGQSLRVTVLAPFYATSWFRTLMAAAVFGLIAALWRYRVAQLEQRDAVRQAFSRRLIASQENERKRIAAELHDTIGQRLVVMKNLAAFFLRAKGQNAADSEDRNMIEEISAEAALAIQETREISYNLRPFQLDRLGLTKAVQSLIRTASTASQMEFVSDIDDIDDIFPEELRINFYRIVQESLNNVVKHAQATQVTISVKRNQERLNLTIADNGRGFTPGRRNSHNQRDGFGLTGMAERAQVLGGEWKVHSTPGGGTTVTVNIIGKTTNG